MSLKGCNAQEVCLEANKCRAFQGMSVRGKNVSKSHCSLEAKLVF